MEIKEGGPHEPFSHKYCALQIFVSQKSENVFCQDLSISLPLNLSLSLRDSDRVDTIITFHHHHPPITSFLRTL